MGLAPLDHNLSHASIDTNFVPTLLTTYQLYDLARNRLVTSEELWLMHDWPVPGLVSPDLARTFPYVIDDMPIGHGRKLIGNSMHVASMGCLGLCMLGFVPKCVPSGSSS